MLRPRRTSRQRPNKGAQQGAAFIVMLVIMVVGVAAVLAGSLQSAEIKLGRDEKTAMALAQAKEALVGLSATYPDLPGSLPCPDTDNDGDSDAGGSPDDCPQYIGRLPWKTLGIADLRDASGERLWYTLSQNVRRYDSVRPLNSDTVGTLNVTGTISASNLLAIIFSPGSNIGTQSRSENNSYCTTTGTTIKQNRCAANYLEGTNANPSNASGGNSPNQNYQTGNVGNSFNDQAIFISHEQLFPLTEKRVGNEIKKMLNAYYVAWGNFPFAAPFVDPSLPFTDPSRPFIGAPDTLEGLVPMGATWTAIPTYSISSGSADVVCELRNGNNSLPNARARCSVSNIDSSPNIQINGTLAGLRLWRPHDLNDVNQVRVRLNGSSVSASSVSGMNAAVSYTMNVNGSVGVTFTGNLVTGVERIELRDVVVDPSVDPVDPDYAWFTRNHWNRIMYYAVSQGYSPTGVNDCTPLPAAPSCLSVSGNNNGNNNRALLIMTGRTIASNHPSGNLSDYLEGENSTPSDNIFESHSISPTFNDQVIVIAP